MKNNKATKQFNIYLWLGLGYFFMGFITTISTYPSHFVAVVFNNLWGCSYLIAVNYILFEYTIPSVLRKRKFILINVVIGMLLLFAHAMLYSYGAYVWRQFGVLTKVYTPLRQFASLDAALENQMGYSMGSVVFFGIIRHLYNYNKLKQATQRLRIEKQEAELNYLKSQTNPHFLFNTLNNIYSLARDKSDLAPESILRLSKILRFMLYEAGGAYIAIEQELKIISDYIALERLRYDESLRINFNHNVENMQQALPPLLLIPLVENAFKHGVSETRGHPFIDIHLSVQQRQLTFIVKNSSEVYEGPVRENIGLSNLRRQLELLYTTYSLDVMQKENVFTTILKINLSNHV